LTREEMQIVLNPIYLEKKNRFCPKKEKQCSAQ